MYEGLVTNLLIKHTLSQACLTSMPCLLRYWWRSGIIFQTIVLLKNIGYRILLLFLIVNHYFKIFCKIYINISTPYILIDVDLNSCRFSKSMFLWYRYVQLRFLSNHYFCVFPINGSDQVNSILSQSIDVSTPDIQAIEAIPCTDDQILSKSISCSVNVTSKTPSAFPR